MTLKVVNNSDPGTADTVGGNDWDQLTEGVNLGEAYKYLVVKSGSTYYVKGSSGEVVHSGTTPATEIQWALDNMTVGRTHKEVLAIRGNITLTGLTIPSYTVLDLTGAYIKQANATNTNFLINNDTSGGNTDIEIMAGTIDGNKANQTADGVNYNTRNIINMTKVSNLAIHDTKMMNSNSSCVYLNDCVNSAIYANTMLDARKTGVYHDGTTAGKWTFVKNNYMYNLGENFVTGSVSSDFYIEGNLCDISGTNGINVNGVRNHILNNIIKTCERGGITMGGEASSGPGDYSEIIGNTCWENKGGGIYSGVAQGGNYVTIANNKIFGHPTLQSTTTGRSFGIRMTGNYGIISDNVVWGHGRSGIAIQGASTTTAYDSRVFSSDRIMIKNNQVHSNGIFAGTEATAYFKAGITVFGSSTETAYNTNIRVIGNTCYNNDQYGIMFRNSTGTVIEDNDVQGNLVGGIQNVASNV